MPLLMCPNCNASMTEVKRNDVAFDMCPTCRGVWLDRGELEKIIAGVHGADAPPAQQFQQQQRSQPQQSYGERGEQGERGYDDDRRGQDDRNQQGRRRRGGFDLFDIFD